VVPGRGGFRRETSTVIGIGLAECRMYGHHRTVDGVYGARFIAITVTQSSTT
jgi:hypothetical protein